MANETEPTKSSKKGYGKLRLWQWVVIYIIVAIVIYGAIYLIYGHYHHSTTSTSGGAHSY
jgi:hypothetical protein